jgi:dolichyl-phosphate beta-glucosyltransferase
VPAYNESSEERNFLKTLESYYNFLDKNYPDFDMGIIPNNCSDNTPKLTAQFVKTHPKAWWHEIKGYSGKGGAVMRGFDIAQGDWIAFVDADGSTSVEEFYKCLRKGIRKRDDGVIASRRMPGAKIEPSRRFFQTASSWAFNFVTNLLFILGYYDTQCGCKIFSKECAKFLVKNYSEVGWNFDVDLLYLCNVNGFEINEYPIKWTDTAGGKVNTLEGIKAVLGLFKYRVKKWKEKLLSNL